MFSYFGSNSKLVRLYPKPLYPRIIEPFAGSARYALRYHNRKVWINDVYPVIYDIWKWIVSATRDDVLKLPDLKLGDCLHDIELDPSVKNLMGFAVSAGCATPHWTATGYAYNGQRDVESSKIKERLLNHVGKLLHWRVTNLDYKELPNVEATWFVDPPYQHMGDRYVHHDIDFGHLGEWCRSRKGQVIVCEGDGFVDYRLVTDQNATGKVVDVPK